MQGLTANNKPIHLLSPVVQVGQKSFSLVLVLDLLVICIAILLQY